LEGKSLRQIKLAGELPLIQHAFRCGVRSDPNLHIDDASAIASAATAAADVPWRWVIPRAVRRTGWTGLNPSARDDNDTANGRGSWCSPDGGG